MSATGRGPATRRFKRRPPDAAEQARRKAWGSFWGPAIKRATEQWKREQR